MTDTGKLAENLVILNRYAENLSVALYNAKHNLDTDTYQTIDTVVSDNTNKTANTRQYQVRLLSDPALQPIVKSLLKKYPECPDLTKVAGYQVLMTEGKDIAEGLKMYYYLFVDVVEFTEQAKNTLVSCEKLSGLNVILSAIITIDAHDLCSARAIII
jgi:hypothetical protein